MQAAFPPQQGAAQGTALLRGAGPVLVLGAVGGAQPAGESPGSQAAEARSGVAGSSCHRDSNREVSRKVFCYGPHRKILPRVGFLGKS